MKLFGKNKMYFFDSYAIIEIIKNSSGYDKFRETQIVTNALHIAEVHYILAEFTGEKASDETVKSLNINLIDITKEIAIEASKLRFNNKKLKLSYADCLGYVCAINNNLKFLTGDDGLKKFDNVEFVK